MTDWQMHLAEEERQWGKGAWGWDQVAGGRLIARRLAEAREKLAAVREWRKTQRRSLPVLDAILEVKGNAT